MKMSEIKEYKGVSYIVHVGPAGSLCAYIRIPEDHRWYYKDSILKSWPPKEFRYDTPPEGERIPDHVFQSLHLIDLTYEEVPLEVHGGLTFSCLIKEGEKHNYPQGFTPGFWVGWDYAHLGDFVPGISKGISPEEIFWGHTSVERECVEAIEQLLENSKEEEKGDEK
jgi:hypothetical protein